jgi:hypothetical protein
MNPVLMNVFSLIHTCNSKFVADDIDLVPALFTQNKTRVKCAEMTCGLLWSKPEIYNIGPLAVLKG